MSDLKKMAFSHSNSHSKKIRWLYFFVFLCGFLFFSCRKGKLLPFLNAIDMVDACISAEQTAEALSLLQKAEKKAFSAFARICVYKRYLALGEEKSAERVLQDGLKKIPDSTELAALYAHFLLRNQRNFEAKKIACRLKKTKYRGLYAESAIKSQIEQNQNDFSTFFSPQNAEIFKISFEVTKNPLWLVNEACIFALNGNFSLAAKLSPSEDFVDFSIFSQDLFDYNFFWAIINFDAKNYALALKFALLADENVKNQKNQIEDAKLLAADCFAFLGDEESAQKMRTNLHSFAGAQLNSAIWAKKTGDRVLRYETLFSLVNDFPEYAPGLYAYGEYAIDCQKERKMSGIERDLRKSSLRTKAMADFDRAPFVNVEDAIFRIQKAIENKASLPLDSDFYDLVVAEKILSHKISFQNNETARFADIWQTLEKYSIGKNSYPEQILQWVIFEFLKDEDAKHISEAKTFFLPYISEKYLKNDDAQNANNEIPDFLQTDIFGGEIKKSKKVQLEEQLAQKLQFFSRAAEYATQMQAWECECLAFFALFEEKNFSSAKIFLENSSSVAATMNLAQIFSCSGKKKAALLLYGDILGRTRNSQTRAEILYRMALLQHALSDDNAAIISLEYCIAQDPDHANARFLLQTLR